MNHSNSPEPASGLASNKASNHLGLINVAAAKATTDKIARIVSSHALRRTIAASVVSVIGISACCLRDRKRLYRTVRSYCCQGGEAEERSALLLRKAQTPRRERVGPRRPRLAGSSGPHPPCRVLGTTWAPPLRTASSTRSTPQVCRWWPPTATTEPVGRCGCRSVDADSIPTPAATGGSHAARSWSTPPTPANAARASGQTPSSRAG